jgi:uncharacterized protein YoxC
MKNLLDKIEDINEDIQSINETIDNLLTEVFNPLTWVVKRLVINKLLGDDDDDEDLSKKEKEDKLKKSYEKWSEEKSENDIDDLVDDIKDISNETDQDVTDKFREMLIDIAKDQKKMLEGILSKKGLDKITVKFNDPIDFKLKRGDYKGKELRLESTKTYDIFMVNDKPRKSKIYFTYKDWVKKYSIMFLMEIKDPKPNEKYSRVTISIVYLNENFLRDQEIKIIEEKVLTHRALVEIKTLS